MKYLSALDFIVLFFYVTIVAGIGWYVSKKNDNTSSEYLLAGRQMGIFVVTLSIIATAASALTFIGVPGAGFNGSFGFVQMGIGGFVGRILVAFLLIPKYYEGSVTTVYEYLSQRFGDISRSSGMLFFIVTRLLASGVRLYGIGLAMAVVMGVKVELAIAVVAIIAIIYTSIGGIRAVMLTDVLQFGLLIVAPIITLIVIFNSLDGGFQEFLSYKSLYPEKFQVFDFSFSFQSSTSFYTNFMFGMIFMLAVFGTDHDLAQRMLTCKNKKDSQISIVLTGILDFPLQILFLSVGVALFFYYQQFPSVEVTQFIADKKPDYVFPFFIVTALPIGVKGLLVSALLAAAMSSLDSAMNALASSAVVDFYRPYFNKDNDEKKETRISKTLVIIFAIILVIVAFACKNAENVLWLGFRIGTYTYGAMLGIFLTGVLSKRGNDIGNVIAMITSVILVILVDNYVEISWLWYVVIGTLWTWVISTAFPKKESIQKVS